MTPDEAVERAAAHAVLLFARTDDWPTVWDDRDEPSKQCWRPDIAEILDASGYPQALRDATALLDELLQHAREWLGMAEQEFGAGDDDFAEEHAFTAKVDAWLAEHAGD